MCAHRPAARDIFIVNPSRLFLELRFDLLD
jgi:hypothetical protein